MTQAPRRPHMALQHEEKDAIGKVKAQGIIT